MSTYFYDLQQFPVKGCHLLVETGLEGSVEMTKATTVVYSKLQWS